MSIEAARFPRLGLAPLETRGLDQRESALARAIYGQVLRRWLTLEWVLGWALDRPLGVIEPPLRAVLLAGSAQILLLDRVPDHAAIFESVQWAKRRVRPGAGGLVNAVLRRIAGLRGADGRDTTGAGGQAWSDRRDAIPRADGSAVVLGAEVLPEDEWVRLSVASSCPPLLLDHWRASFGPERARVLALHSICEPPVILNVAHVRPDQYGPVPGDLLGTHEADGSRVFVGDRAALLGLLGARDDVWVQDPGSSRAVEAIGSPGEGFDPRLIVDLCAGRGTKTRQLAAGWGGAKVLATDADERRVEELRAVFAGHERVKAMAMDRVLREAGGRTDLVLLDVPCSNTGVLPRRVEARYRFGGEATDRLIREQRRILDAGGSLMAPGARLAYSTCSLNPAENADQARWVARRHGLRLVRQHEHQPTGVPGDEPGRYSDGSFVAVLESGGRVGR